MKTPNVTEQSQDVAAGSTPATGSANRGYMHERTAHNKLEKSFAEKWESENQMRPWLNFGHGILQDLFMKGSHYFPECHHEVTASERMVAATVVQWLGTNVGRSFLEAALSDAGYKIVKQDSPNDELRDGATERRPSSPET